MAYSAELVGDLHRVAHAVSALGGAVGWVTPPATDAVDTLLRSSLAAVAAGAGGLCAATVDGRIEAMGIWRRAEAENMRHLAELTKVMAHPGARGLGLGERITRALLEAARAAGIETVHLGVRGNNRLAIELYQRVGFQIWGRLPDVIEVGAERFDDVRMFAVLGRAEGVVLRGSAPGGPGSSPARGTAPGSQTAPA